jgi:sigma-B regulation protein RsbU (phosphoserine phosphatase)
MARSRAPDATSEGRRAPLALPPGVEPSPSARDILLKTWPGRLFLIAAGLKLLVALLRRAIGLPAFVEILDTAATLGLIVSLFVFTARLFTRIKRRLLWRVRRKLILSYIFIGVVPAALIIGFFVLGALVISMNVSAYLFRDGYDEIVSLARLAAEGAASEIGRNPATTSETIARVQRNTSRRYQGLSMAFVPTAKDSPPFVRAGAWEHTQPPTDIPEWLMLRSDGFSGTVALSPGNGRDDVELVVRAAVASISETRRLGYVYVDIPIDPSVLDGLHETTGMRAGAIDLDNPDPLRAVESLNSSNGGGLSLFGRSVTILDARDWGTGADKRATIAYTYRMGELYTRLSRVQQVMFGSMTFGEAILYVFGVVATLFFIIQIAALVMGLALARSITSSIHELFMGTERVRHGDFGHRINIPAKDQLGELADSFNQMTGSIENLLQTAAEKKRLEEELRIARQIQMSLLPRGQLDVPGLSVTALCVPAREVGGDYYDFFPLPQNKLGLLIADVSGKGTSAALYMAELKGLVLSLSQIYESPRQLLLEVNRIISENLDSRSFITMTYAVLDLGGGVLTHARAGHTPMIYLPGPGASKRGAQVLTPNGMVLGLRIDGANEKFAELLEEKRIDLSAGDVIVLYTDGITEAMNAHSDLFGESRLSRIVEEHGHLESGELRERILREIEAFVGGADQHDDMTMILLKIEKVMAERVAV